MVVVDVLTQQHYLAGSCLDRLPALGLHVMNRHVLLASAHARNDAERAVVVAALNDPHEMTDPSAPGLRHRLAKRVVIASLQAGDELVVFGNRHHRVEMWEAAPQVLSFLGHDAPRDGHCPFGGLPRSQLMQLRVDALL